MARERWKLISLLIPVCSSVADLCESGSIHYFIALSINWQFSKSIFCAVYNTFMAPFDVMQSHHHQCLNIYTLTDLFFTRLIQQIGRITLISLQPLLDSTFIMFLKS